MVSMRQDSGPHGEQGRGFEHRCRRRSHGDCTAQGTKGHRGQVCMYLYIYLYIYLCINARSVCMHRRILSPSVRFLFVCIYENLCIYIYLCTQNRKIVIYKAIPFPDSIVTL